MEQDFSPKGVRFYYVYKSLAHPENNGYVAPYNLQERLMHVAEAKKVLGTRIPFLCDSMNNDLKHALGDAPNSQFVINPDGIIESAVRWSDPVDLRKMLTNFVGEPDQTTSPASLNMPRIAPAKTAAKGIVPRVQLPGSMTPILVLPIEQKSRTGKPEPFYAKLRAELDQSFSRNGRGTLYLGFFLDPLYKVHWNNLSEPLDYKLETPDGVTVSPATGTAPEVKQPADADPREFLLEIDGRSTQPLTLTVRYFACDDAETFCEPVTQKYEIVLQRDSDGGSRRGRSSRGGRQAGRQRSPFGQFGQFGRQQSDPFVRMLDRDGDGTLNEEEMRDIQTLLQRMDPNRDGSISPDELRNASQRVRSGQRGRRPGGN